MKIENELTVGGNAREKLEILINSHSILLPAKIAFTFIKESAILRSLALSLSTGHLITDILCTHKMKNNNKNTIIIIIHDQTRMNIKFKIDPVDKMT